MEVKILPESMFVKEGSFNLEEALEFGAKCAGVCYSKDGFEAVNKEEKEKTKRRINMTLENGHHSVYGHGHICLYLKNIPKILAMVLNNEKEYTTSEKSGRYTKIIDTDPSNITDREVELYCKWEKILKIKIKEKYGYFYNENQIVKLARENARYFISVFATTEMIYTTSLRQINYIASWMNEYANESDSNFSLTLSYYMLKFIKQLEGLNLLEKGLMNNEKKRKLSLFGKDLENKKEFYSDVYQTVYQGSWAEIAQAHRHRTINYQIEQLEEKEYFIPPIIEDDEKLVKEWKNDMYSVEDITPQGELLNIFERGIYEDFILKLKERLCTHPQLEICNTTKETLTKYLKYLEENNDPLKDDIIKYTHGARCSFGDYKCPSPCGFEEGIKLIRKI